MNTPPSLLLPSLEGVARVPHGSTDGGPAPLHDFSSNANALGPDPYLLQRLREVDPRHYPDPRYGKLCQKLGEFRDTDPRLFVPGAGVSELLVRLSGALPGPVALLAPCFGEYERAACLSGKGALVSWTRTGFLDHLEQAGWALLNQPVNPTGRILSESFLAQVEQICQRRGIPLVLDLAYDELTEKPVAIPETAWRLVSPNKRHGLTGVRAAWLETTSLEWAEILRERAHAWVVSAHGVAFLEGCLTRESRLWLRTTLDPLREYRQTLETSLRAIGLLPEPTHCNFLLVDVGDAPRVTAALRERGIRVRDASSFGFARHLRVSAQTPEATRELCFHLSNGIL
jgi:histidinol-phosphate aminotransferase